jgi:hypothetical protein
LSISYWLTTSFIFSKRNFKNFKYFHRSLLNFETLQQF